MNAKTLPVRPEKITLRVQSPTPETLRELTQKITGTLQICAEVTVPMSRRPMPAHAVKKQCAAIIKQGLFGDLQTLAGAAHHAQAHASGGVTDELQELLDYIKDL